MATIGAIPSPPPKWNEETFDVASIVDDIIELVKEPVNNSQFVFLNGVFMTNGANFDYVLTGNIITFNSGVLTNSGHVTVKYSFS